MHICARHQVSMIKPVARRTFTDDDDNENDNTRLTIYNCVGSLAFLSNEPINRATMRL